MATSLVTCYVFVSVQAGFSAVMEGDEPGFKQEARPKVTRRGSMTKERLRVEASKVTNVPVNAL